MAHGVFPAMGLERAPGGLFSVAKVSNGDTAGVRWQDGPFSWDTITSPLRVSVSDVCSNGEDGLAIECSAPPAESWPFGIVTNYRCSTVGYSVEDRRRFSLRQLEIVTEKVVEAQLWSGAVFLAANRLTVPYLSNNNAVTVSGAGDDLSVAQGIARLEQALSSCGLGVQGVIHLTREAASIATEAGAIKRDGSRLHTVLGTPVVAGSGYDPETVPTEPVETPIPAPGPLVPPSSSKQWGYATGPLAVQLSAPEFIGETLERSSNTLGVLSGRTAAVYWDSCCTASVEMDTSL